MTSARARILVSFLFAFIIPLLSFPSTLFSFPDQEKAVLTPDGVTSQATSFIAESDQFLFLSFGGSIVVLDTETFDAADNQVPALVDNSGSDGNDLTGDVEGLAVRSSRLYASQSDGDLLTINLDDITAEPSTFHVLDGALGRLVADTETGSDDDKLYIINKASDAVTVFDIGDETSTAIPIVDGLGAPVTPVSIVFDPFPTDKSSSSTDKIYVTSDRGLVFVILEGGVGIASTITLSATNKELPAAALTPGGDYLLVVNATDTTVHVIDTATDTEVDTDPMTGGTNPIALPMNASLSNIVVTDVTNPSDIYAFVTGSRGISVIDLNISPSDFGQPTVIDFDDNGSGDTDDDPMPLSSAPGPIVASSVGDGYVYTSNSNATISVVTDNPFVTITSTSLGGGVLSTDDSFTVTFRSDETGNYRVVVGGDLSGSGWEVTTGTVDTADTELTTDAIAYDASIFVEGINRVFVFVTDSSGNIGRAAVDIEVNTPPGGVEIRDTGFGDEKIYVEFTRLTADDIDHYNIYLDIDPDVVGTKSEAAGTLSQPDSGETLEAKITGLINGVTYYIGIEGVDTSGLVGPRTTTFSDGSPAFAIPEETRSLTETVGETGCSLGRGQGQGVRGHGSWAMGIALVLPILLFIVFRGRRTRKIFFFLLLFLLPITPYPLPITHYPLLSAIEKTPQWWSLEVKGGAWLPINRVTKDFLGCCAPTGMAEFGFLYDSKFGAEVGVGYIGAGGFAIGTTSGAVSRDRFDFTMIPIQNSFAFRADFKEDQLLVPYVKTGLDYIIYRENKQGEVTSGVKLGLHGTLGLQILLDKIEGLSMLMEDELGVNDVYFVVEGRYAWVNGFGKRGLSLSNITCSGGFLFEF